MKTLKNLLFSFALFVGATSYTNAKTIDPEIMMDRLDHYRVLFHQMDIPSDTLEKAKGIIIISFTRDEVAPDTIASNAGGMKFQYNESLAPIFLNVSGGTEDAALLLMSNDSLKYLVGEATRLNTSTAAFRNKEVLVFTSESGGEPSKSTPGSLSISPNTAFNNQVYNLSPKKIIDGTAKAISNPDIRVTANALMNGTSH